MQTHNWVEVGGCSLHSKNGISYLHIAAEAARSDMKLLLFLSKIVEAVRPFTKAASPRTSMPPYNQLTNAGYMSANSVYPTSWKAFIYQYKYTWGK